MATASTTVRNPWLYGPFWDLMLGCGGLYFIVFIVLWASGPRIMDIATFGLVPFALLLTSVPHYGATLLRVYERREDRRTYTIFAVWAAILVWAVFVWGVYNVAIGNLMVTIFLTWSPWHYSGQNYGIGLMLLGRGGVRVTPLAKRFIWASFFLSWLLVVFSTNGAVGGDTYAPTPTSLTESAYVFVPIGIPTRVLAPLLVVTTLAYASSLVGAFGTLRRQASWGQLTPLVAVIVLQGLFFSFPVLSRVAGVLGNVLPLAAQYHGYTLLWVALAHSLQYLWVTTFFATTAKTDARRGLYWIKSYLAGGALFAVPVFLFAPYSLGVYSFESGLGVLIAAAVNLHHFILDGAIWKLRDGRIARILLRRETSGFPVQRPVDSRQWPRRLTWSLIGVAGIAYGIFYSVGTWELEYGFRRALNPPDLERLRTAARRLHWVGHDHPALHLDLGVLAVRDGDLETGQNEAERSLALGPNVQSWMLLGQIHEQKEEWKQARGAYDSALALDPAYVPALAHSALVSAKMDDFDRAEQTLALAVKLAPGRQDLQQRLEQIQRHKRGVAEGPEPWLPDRADEPVETRRFSTQ